MPPDFRFITHAAQGNADEVSVHGPGDGSRQGRLADSGRSHETEDGTFHFLHQGLNRKVFQDPLLGFFQPVMVLIQDAGRLVDIDLVFGLFKPGQRKNPVDVIPDNRRFRTHG